MRTLNLIPVDPLTPGERAAAIALERELFAVLNAQGEVVMADRSTSNRRCRASVSQAVVPLQPSPIVRYEEMCRAITAAYAVDEVKDMRDKALALEIYARQAQNTEAEQQACEIRLRAERRVGQLLLVREKAKGGRPSEVQSNPSRPVTGCQQTLTDLGISRNQSSRWQKIATVPEPTFEEAVRQPKATTTSIAALAPASPITDREHPIDPKALWLWGRLQDFQRQGLLDADPNALIDTMTEHMKVTVRELAPHVVAWLGRIIL